MAMKNSAYSNIDIPKESNIVTVENLSESAEGFFLKTNKKGKLFRGPNWTAYNKSNLGSIPRRVEKNIIEDTNVQAKMAFTTSSERFCDFAQKIKNPGPGSYEISKPFDSTRTTSSLHSTKGFGNGFVSSAERFDDNLLYYGKYLPGPGEYCNDSKGTLAYKVMTSPHGKNLFNTKKTKSLAVKHLTPGPGYYSPLLDPTNHYLSETEKSSFFECNINRFQKKDKKKYPGPGYYFWDLSNTNTIKNPAKNSYFFKSKSIEKEDPLTKLDIKTIQVRGDVRYKLVEKKGKIVNCVQSGMNNQYDEAEKRIMTTKELFRFKNKPMPKSKNKDLPDVKPLEIRSANAIIDDKDKGYEYIHKILQKENKPDLFELSPPRWQQKEEFKVPGPAYYRPRIQNPKLSFNKNSNQFIIPCGIGNNEDDISIEHL